MDKVIDNLSKKLTSADANCKTDDGKLLALNKFRDNATCRLKNPEFESLTDNKILKRY